MQQITVNKLKAHPRNSEFFDDMTGDTWKAFLESIKTSGVIEPVVITPEKIIISGHQRVRACKELGITTILTDMRDYSDEDKIDMSGKKYFDPHFKSDFNIFGIRLCL